MIVVKIGGAKGINYDKVLADAAFLIKEGEELLIVNGGKGELEDVATKMGNPPQWVKTASGYTSRRTDKETMGMFTMVYAGKMNKMIVEKLQALDINAVGLSGIDGGMVTAKKKNIIVQEGEKKIILRDDYTGKIEEVNITVLETLIDAGFSPVVCPPVLSEEGEALNVDGDRMAAALAEAFGAETVVYLSNVPGLLRDKDDESTLVKKINKKKVDEAMELAQGTMKKKVMGAIESLNAGVAKVIFADARVDEPIRKALAGKGTIIS